jgi:integrase
VSKVRVFFRWCRDVGIITHDPARRLDESPLRTYCKTYGKVQARNPGRWLTHDEAYGQLVAACQDDTVIGLRDELVVRLGLAGMRAAEIASLNIDNLRQLPKITWTGKKYRPAPGRRRSGPYGRPGEVPRCVRPGRLRNTLVASVGGEIVAEKVRGKAPRFLVPRPPS